MSINLKPVTDTSFEADVLQSEIPVLVDFWALWCAPCRQLAPVLESTAEKYLGKVKFLSLDAAQNQASLAEYNVRGIPTLIIYKDGKEIARHVGGDLTSTRLSDFIDANV